MRSGGATIPVVLAAMTAALLLPACGPREGSGSGLKGEVGIDGSSTVYPIAEALAEEFETIHRRVRVSVGRSGTGGGFKRFTRGDIDLLNASRPILGREDDAARANGVEFMEVPIAYDGITVVVNPRNDWVDHLDLDELRRIFLEEEKAQSWSQVRPGFPERQIRIFTPGTDSGTFDFFREVVAGEERAIRSDMSVSEDDNQLVRGVSGEVAAIGFFGYAYFQENRSRLRAVPIDGGQGPVRPAPESIRNGSYLPFTRPLFLYVNSRALDRGEIAAFMDFSLQDGPALAESVGYVMLPGPIYARARENVAQRRVGTHFLDEQGRRRHGPLEELYP